MVAFGHIKCQHKNDVNDPKDSNSVDERDGPRRRTPSNLSDFDHGDHRLPQHGSNSAAAAVLSNNRASE